MYVHSTVSVYRKIPFSARSGPLLLTSPPPPTTLLCWAGRLTITRASRMTNLRTTPTAEACIVGQRDDKEWDKERPRGFNYEL